MPKTTDLRKDKPHVHSSRMSINLNQLRLAISLLLVLVLHSNLPALASNNDTTTIVIVGTVHERTDNFTPQKLYGIIEQLNPDLMLVELDSSFLTPSMSIKSEFLHISLENTAVADYQQAHRIPIRPYDIEGRNRIYERRNYFQLQKDLSKALDQAAKDSLLRGEAAMLLDAIVRFDHIGRAFALETPEVINSNPCDIAMESKQFYANEGMVNIVSSVPVLKQFEGIAKFKRDFWITRNDAMVTNILRWAKLLHPRRIVVLCGFEHRYFLREALKKRSILDKFTLREYWTY